MFGDDVKIVDKGEAFDDGDYFEVGADGKVKMKKGNKIDLSKLSKDDLKKMGIDPTNMSKEELARAIKVPHDMISGVMRKHVCASEIDETFLFVANLD